MNTAFQIQITVHNWEGGSHTTTKPITLNDIKFEVNRVKAEVINTYDICKDIEYSVEKKSADTVDIHITKLLFDGIITEIDVYVTVEVE